VADPDATEAPARGRLGRGLSALLGDRPAGPAGEPGPVLLDLPLAAIRPNPDQPRRRIDPDALESLAASLRASGVVQPVVVRPVAGEPGAWELIAGERRWRAAGLAGLDRVPAVVRAADDRDRLEVALVENLVREDLNPVEVAQACATLLEDFGQTQAALAQRLGRSRPAISNLLRLLELPEDVQDLLAHGALSEGHGRAILMADGARRRRELAARAVDEGLSVRQTEALARAAAARPAQDPRPDPPEPPEEADRVMDAFHGAFGAAVRVRGTARGAVVVELRFADADALAAALARLPSG
jgi:ParB family chromosome partitioning protein